MSADQVSYLSGIWLIFKVAIIVLVFFYFLFTLIVSRQIDLMTQTVQTALLGPLRLLGKLHILAGLAILVATYFLLFGSSPLAN